MDIEGGFAKSSAADNVATRYLRPIPLLVIATAQILLMMGRQPVCKGGDAWCPVSATIDDHLSQHLLDPYALTHMLHGLLLRTAGERLGIFWAKGLLITTFLACTWEVLENTDTVIGWYRADAQHLGYYGDSVTNSLGDIVACLAGWALAGGVGEYISALIFLATEVLLSLWIGDTLSGNVVLILRMSRLSALGVVGSAWIIKVAIEAWVGTWLMDKLKGC